MKAIMGTKITMTQLFDNTGILIPVTIIKAEPNIVMENKNQDKNKYISTKLGYKDKRAKSVKKPEQGVFNKLNAIPKVNVREIRNMTGYNVGDYLDVSIFNSGDIVDVQGYTKGHGFTGAIKRWNLSIGPMGHGAGYPHRFQGSSGGGRGGSSAQHVFKGKHMSGRYGNELVTVENLTVVSVDPENHLIYIKGAIPGPKGSVVTVKTAHKKPGVNKPLELVDVKELAEKNHILEEAKHFGLKLNNSMELAEMKKLVQEAKEAKNKNPAE